MRISDWSSDVCSSDLQITGRQPADEKHRFLPGAEAAEERDEHTLTGLGHATIIGGHCLRFGHYPGSRSERRWSAMSLARPAPCRRSRYTWHGADSAIPSPLFPTALSRLLAPSMTPRSNTFYTVVP